jgi:hypothetical protein
VDGEQDRLSLGAPSHSRSGICAASFISGAHEAWFAIQWWASTCSEELVLQC